MTSGLLIAFVALRSLLRMALPISRDLIMLKGTCEEGKSLVLHNGFVAQIRRPEVRKGWVLRSYDIVKCRRNIMIHERRFRWPVPGPLDVVVIFIWPEGLPVTPENCERVLGPGLYFVRSKAKQAFLPVFGND